LWKDSVETAKQCNIAVQAVEKRLEQRSFRLAGFVVESTIGQRRCKERDKDEFRKGVFYPILDHMTAEMKRRFNQPGNQGVSRPFTMNRRNGACLSKK